MPKTIKSQKGQNNPNYKHGGKHTKLYEVWCSMRHRCNNPTDYAYKYYGARGIKVCKEWEKDYSAFREWALKNGYSEGLTIDRINVYKDYCPQNCRWATAKQQSDNKTTTKRIEYNGITKTLKEWSIYLGIEIRTLYCRIYRLGWNVERAFTEKVSKNRYDRQTINIEKLKEVGE